MRLSRSFVDIDFCQWYRVPLCRMSSRQVLCLWTTFPGACALAWYAIQLHDRVVHVLDEFILEAGATKGRNLRLDVRRIRSGASRHRLGDVVRLHFKSPYRRLVVEVTVTLARTNMSVPQLGARLPLPCSLAMGAQHGKLDVELDTSTLFGSPSVQSVQA
jgi:hypothetical protein